MTRKALLFIFFGAAGTTGCAQMSQDLVETKDTLAIPASKQYRDPSLFKRVILGNNYRKEWSVPVSLPVFHLASSGLKIKELGGGQQTKSLRLLDKNGREWALRTIDKNVTGAMPPLLRNTVAQKITQDMVSAAHPYAPLVITPLQKAINVIASEPVFYYVPDDTAFGEFRSIFANTVCMLENREPTPDATKTENTKEVVAALLKNNDFIIDEEAVLRARLLDMLIADWDRHQDQWRWGIKKEGSTNYFYAIPRDRDQAFFYSNGLLVKLARLIALKHLVGFTRETDKIKKLNAKTWNFDRTFLNELDARQWQRIIEKFQAALTDEVIIGSVKKMPPSVYNISGLEIQQKLISRRNDLKDDALDYYRFISQQVTILGSDAAERFRVSGSKDSITISVYDKTKNIKLYQRTFYPKETDKIYMLGLGGDDEYTVDEQAVAKIRLQMDGGKGKNSYKINSRIKKQIINSDADAKSYEPVMKELLRIKD